MSRKFHSDAPNRKIRKGDEVIVIAGKDKGKRGIVARVDVADSRVVVEGLNMARKHQKPRSQEDRGGIIDIELPIHVSNVAIFNKATNKADKVGFKILEDGKKVRIFRSTQEHIDV